MGAPYETDGDSTGVVYIFYGNSDITAFRKQIPARVSVCVCVCVCVCVAFLRSEREVNVPSENSVLL